jgi:hypothetical protein
MSVVRKLLGTIEDRFWLFQDSTANLLGVYAVNPDGDHIEFRDANNVFIRLSGADGVDPEDYATMNQIGGGGGGGSALEWISVPIAFGDVGGTPPVSIATVPDGAMVLDVRVNVTAAWDVDSTVTAELTGQTPFLAASDSQLDDIPRDYLLSLVSANGTGGPLTITCTVASGGTPTTGAGTVLVGYATPAL